MQTIFDSKKGKECGESFIPSDYKCNPQKKKSSKKRRSKIVRTIESFKNNIITNQNKIGVI